MSCNNCNTNTCNPCDCTCTPIECGCPFYVESLSCIRHDGADLDCLGLSTGATLEQIILAIEERICDVTNGSDGDSAYEVAVGNGFMGTEAEWLESLVGECDCADELPQTVLYSEVSSLTGPANLGTWIDIELLSGYTTIDIPAFSYTIPVGGAGAYEVQLQGLFSYTEGSIVDSESGLLVEVKVDGVTVPNSTTVVVVGSPKTPFMNISLFQSNISITAGALLTVGVACKHPSNTVMRNVKYKLTKLA